MSDRKKYYKDRSKKRIKQTNEYKELLNKGSIDLINFLHIIKCKICEKEKIAKDNFYIRRIRLSKGDYYGTFAKECIDCLRKKTKQNGKLFNVKLIEEQTKKRQCRKCLVIKELNAANFRLTQKKYLRRICLDCDRKEANESTKKRLIYARESIRSAKRKYQKNRRKRDPVYKMRKYISTAIYRMLKSKGAVKDSSIMNYLPYSIKQLNEYIENKFDFWMTWDNIGRFNNKTWDNNDSSTWVWNLDHIIPQSDLPFVSMEEENFKKCWALINLRPYSAKQNLIDGNRRNRKSIL